LRLGERFRPVIVKPVVPLEKLPTSSELPPPTAALVRIAWFRISTPSR